MAPPRDALLPQLNIDIILGLYKLEDQFEWVIESVCLTLEQFAEIRSKSFGPDGEFRSVICANPREAKSQNAYISGKATVAHSVRERVQILVGHLIDGSAGQDDALALSHF